MTLVAVAVAGSIKNAACAVRLGSEEIGHTTQVRRSSSAAHCCIVTLHWFEVFRTISTISIKTLEKRGQCLPPFLACYTQSRAHAFAKTFMESMQGMGAANSQRWSMQLTSVQPNTTALTPWRRNSSKQRCSASAVPGDTLPVSTKDPMASLNCCCSNAEGVTQCTPAAAKRSSYSRDDTVSCVASMPTRVMPRLRNSWRTVSTMCSSCTCCGRTNASANMCMVLQGKATACTPALCKRTMLRFIASTSIAAASRDPRIALPDNAGGTDTKSTTNAGGWDGLSR